MSGHLQDPCSICCLSLYKFCCHNYFWTRRYHHCLTDRHVPTSQDPFCHAAWHLLGLRAMSRRTPCSPGTAHTAGSRESPYQVFHQLQYWQLKLCALLKRAPPLSQTFPIKGRVLPSASSMHRRAWSHFQHVVLDWRWVSRRVSFLLWIVFEIDEGPTLHYSTVITLVCHVLPLPPVVTNYKQVSKELNCLTNWTTRQYNAAFYTTPSSHSHTRFQSPAGQVHLQYQSFVSIMFCNR